jgi:hypothetical protein
MSEADVLKVALAIIGALIGVLYGAVQFEIRKLRKAGHRQANRLTEHSIALSLVCQKVGLDFKPRGGDDE